ncbi:hypothetical protein [Archangium lansingense]|uniref:Uncharacterized protein n=1 Tax=Archangium lansingense TaxID=2995310 RepID=A0ABT4A261_9BACT|nr:hypothetical protein [Archangium lansinium]MCY1075735.1 hypothetical protein [Archangium lansinium]
MSDEAEVQLPAALWFGETPHSKKLAPGALGLDFTVAPARGPEGPTVALFGAFALSAPYTLIYRAQLSSAIHIVAVHARTGRVHVNKPADPNALPISATMPKDLDAAIAQANPLERGMVVQTFFNVDLAAHLVLPPEEGDYHVFLWLDDRVTPVRTVHVPANPARQSFGGGVAIPLALGDTASSPQPRDGAIALERPADGTRLFGALPASALPQEPEAAGSPPPPLTLLAFCQRSRNFGWSTVPVAREMREAKSHAFSFEPSALVRCGDVPEQTYLLAMFGALRSDVVKLPQSSR